MSPPSGELHRNVWAASITSFLTDVSSEMIFHLLPLFLANVLGVRTAAIGFVEGVAESVSSLLKVASGSLSDLSGKRKRLAVLGYAVSAAAKPFLYVAGSWASVLAIRAAERFGKGIRSAPRDALLAESVPASERGRAFGLHRAFDSGGAVVGLVVALAVVWSAQEGSLALEPETFRFLVLVALVPAFAAVLVLALGARETGVAAERRGGRPKLTLRGYDASFLRFLGAVLLFTLGNSSDAFLVLRAQERGLSVAGILGMILAFNVVYTAVAAPAGRLSDTLGRKRLIACGWLFYAALYSGFALSETASHVVTLFVLYGVYYGLVEGAARAFVSDLVPQREKLGSAYGLYYAAVGAAALPASVLAGILWQGIGAFEGLGPRAPFVFGAALAIAATGLLVTVSAPTPVLSSRSEPPAPGESN